ncbi:hypothetical protein [Actinomadura nitritigenes]|uniref:hypothetical protein n=1 Tax=Actinomadura nitritigenes TaxID=134602 RepID=UPI003D8B76BF
MAIALAKALKIEAVNRADAAEQGEPMIGDLRAALVLARRRAVPPVGQRRRPRG